MFDLELIEKDWLENSYKLTEEEILEIFKEDNATIPQYKEELKNWFNNTAVSAEERLIALLFNDSEIKSKCKEKRNYQLTHSIPEKQHLSKENQKKVVEGSMNLVFESIRYYYDIFNYQISVETLYYLLLETLINDVRYMCHSGKLTFNKYIKTSFRNSITRYIANIQHISLYKVKNITGYYQYILRYKDEILKILEDYNLEKEDKEILASNSKISFMLRDKALDSDVMDDINNYEFFKEYKELLDSLSIEERLVMQLSYDKYGYLGLTYDEIADYLGISKDNVKNIKRKALRHIRKYYS